MERKKKEEKKPTWRKITPGTLYPFPRNASRAVRGMGDTIEATEEELGKYIDQFEAVKAKDVKEDPQAVKEAAKENATTFKVVDDGSGKYNVIGEDDEPQNEEPLSVDEANAMKDALDKEAIADAEGEALGGRKRTAKKSSRKK